MLRLVRWHPHVDEDDDHFAYKHSVAGSALADPLATLTRAAAEVGVPSGALARHVLVEWASSGAAALLGSGPDVIEDLVAAARAVDEAPMGLARDEAWQALRGRLEWLAHGLEHPDETYPWGGASRAVRQRVGAYGLAATRHHVLLVRVADGYPGAGRWTLPGGGLEHGEDPLDGLVREFEEETGLVPEIGEFLTSDSHHLVDDTRDLHLLRFVWRVEVPTRVEPRVLEVDGSTDTAAWLSTAELRDAPLLSIATRALQAAGLSAPSPDRRGGAV